jgi:hypothetical protein
MAVTTYSSLKAALTTYMARGTDIDAQRDDWIDMAEAYFNRVLRCFQMEESATLTTDTDGEAVLPTGFLAFRSVRYSSSPSVELFPVSRSGSNILSPYDTSDTPRWYSISTSAGTSSLRTVPIKSSAELLVRYYEKIPALNDTTTTNWLLDLAPDIYFYRCLSEAWAFNRDYDKAAATKRHCDDLCSELRLLDEQSRYHNAGIVYDGVTD